MKKLISKHIKSAQLKKIDYLHANDDILFSNKLRGMILRSKMAKFLLKGQHIKI